MGISAHTVSPDRALDTTGLGMIDAIAKWCESLQGHLPIAEAMSSLAQALGAEAMALTRADRRAPSDRNSLFFDTERENSRLPRLDRSYIDAILGNYVRHPKTGSVWFKSLSGNDDDPRLSAFHSRRRFNDVAVIVLSVEEKMMVFLELHFATHHGSGHHAVINMAAQTLADTWSRRRPGLMTELILNRRSSADAMQIRGADVLSSTNPAGLSRSEFRVCLALSRGLSTKGICKELRISESTLRSHLRSVYAKTDTHGHAELLFLLLSPKPAVADNLQAVGHQ